MPRCADRKLNRGCDCGPHAEPLLGAALLEPFHLGETGLAARRIERSMAAWVVSTTSSPESAALDGRHSSRAAGWSAWHVAQAVLGYACESHWLRAARRRPGHLFPHPRKQSGYIKRGFAQRCPWSNALSGTWRGQRLWLDNTWIADSTPVPRANPRPSVQRCELPASSTATAPHTPGISGACACPCVHPDRHADHGRADSD